MPEIEIPPALAVLQRAVDAAQAAVRDHHRANGAVLDWDDETRAEADRLEQAWKTAAAELQAGIEAEGAEVGQSYDYRRALRAAAREG